MSDMDFVARAMARSINTQLADPHPGNGLDLIGRSTVSQLLASDQRGRGPGAKWYADHFSYTEAAPSASESHLTTAGGVKLNVDHVTGLYVEAFGAKGDGVTDDTAAIQKASDVAFAANVPLIFGSAKYRTTATLTLRAPVIIGNGAYITKDIDAVSPGTPVIILVGVQGGSGAIGAGGFRRLVGKLAALQSSLPPSGYSKADGFQFAGVIHAKIDYLEAQNVYYAFRTYVDTTLGEMLFWSNEVGYLYARGTRGGYLRIGFNAFGGNTECVFHACYFNGQETNTANKITQEAVPIYLNQCEGFKFGILNLEWTKITASGGNAFINLQNTCNVTVDHAHFEGWEVSSPAEISMFVLGNAGTTSTKLYIGTMHLVSFQVTAFMLHFCRADSPTKGRMEIRTLEHEPGYPISSITNTFDVLKAGGNDNFSLHFGERSGFRDLPFTALRSGSVPTNLEPNIWFGSRPYEADYAANNPGATVKLAKGGYMKLTGTSTADITTLTVAQRDSYEWKREITIENETGGPINVTSIGNLKLPYGVTSPLVLPVGARMLISWDFAHNKGRIIGAA